MENDFYEYDYDGIKLELHYETEGADSSVGIFNQQVFLISIIHKGDDITDLVGKTTFDFLESELVEYLYA
jgi:hypothetical protein